LAYTAEADVVCVCIAASELNDAPQMYVGGRLIAPTLWHDASLGAKSAGRSDSVSEKPRPVGWRYFRTGYAFPS